jgi:hypothetical protein
LSISEEENNRNVCLYVQHGSSLGYSPNNEVHQNVKLLESFKSITNKTDTVAAKAERVGGSFESEIDIPIGYGGR